MRPQKILYINLIIFFFFLIVAFLVGFFVLRNMGAIPASAQETAVDETPPQITNVKVDDLSATSTTITWETDKMSDSLINYGIDKNYGIVRDPRADKTVHSIVLDNLLSNTDYYFRITSADGNGNQGISNDFNFKTAEIKRDEFTSTSTEKNTPVQVETTVKDGNTPNIVDTGVGGLNEEGITEVLQAIQKVNTVDVLEKIQQEIQEKAQEIDKPPTIILDLATVEVGTDYARISWETDKESDSIVALVDEKNYNETAADPYTWREGSPDVYVLNHMVEVNGLAPSTVYHFQVSSKSAIGLKGVSMDKTFKTKSILPEIYNVQVVKIEETSATIRWTTNIPCSAIVEYTNLNNNDTKMEGNSAFVTAHSTQLTNLVFDTYYSAVIRVESEAGEKAVSEPITFITIRDEAPPIISKVTTESTIYPGADNKIQTIISWRTDEAASCQLSYQQGLISLSEPEILPKEEDFGTKHVQVGTNFLPAQVYKFWVICEDAAQNSVRSEDFTMLTPSQEESIIDIIIKNFESSFGWLKKK